MSGRALVTGAARRLGREMALYLAGRGYAVAVHYATSRTEAEEVAALIRAQGGKAATLAADLLDGAACADLVPRAAEALGGRLTLLVNNASTFAYDNLATASAESWEQNIGSNLRAPLFLTQAFAAQAPRVGVLDGEPLAHALVVNMLDQRVLKLTPEFMTYSLAKSALWTFTRTAAQALAPDIRVNAIGPGPTLPDARQSGAQFAAHRASMPLGRSAVPQDVTAALGYLIDAKSVTGQLICVDGGQHLAWRTPDIQGRSRG